MMTDCARLLLTAILLASALILPSLAEAQPSPSAIFNCTTATNCGSAANQASYTTPSVTAHAGRLILLMFGATQTGDPAYPTVSGWGATWTPLNITNAVTSGVKAFMWCTILGADQTGTITFTPTTTPTRVYWQAVEWTGADVSGACTAGIAQTRGGNVPGATSLTVTLSSAYASASNRPYAWFYFHNSSPATLTTEAGWTAMTATSTTGEGGSAGEWRTDTTDLSATMTSNLSSFFVGVMAEIKASAACSGKLTLISIGC